MEPGGRVVEAYRMHPPGRPLTMSKRSGRKQNGEENGEQKIHEEVDEERKEKKKGIK